MDIYSNYRPETKLRTDGRTTDGRTNGWTDGRTHEQLTKAISDFGFGMILAISDLQVTTLLPTKFGVSWLVGTGEEIKNKFSRWPP